MPYMTAIKRVATKNQLRRGFAPAGLGLSGPTGSVGAANEQTMDWALFAGVGLLATAAGIVGITYWKEHQLKSNPTGYPKMSLPRDEYGNPILSSRKLSPAEMAKMRRNTKAPVLVSSSNTKAAEKKIRSAASARFGRGRADLFFEHGRWFARIDDGDRDQDYSVVDAYPGIAGTGIDFEDLG